MDVTRKSAVAILVALLSMVAALNVWPRWLAAEASAGETGPIRALMFTGGCCHDYDRQKLILADGIGRRTDVEWTIVHEGGSGTKHQYEMLSKDGWEKDYDIVVYNMCFAATTDQQYIKGILKPHKAGLPAVVIHCTMHTFRDTKDDIWREFLGVTSKQHGAQFPIHVHTVVPDHPILKGLPKEWKTPQGELYHIERLWPAATALAIGTRDETLNDSGHACVWVNSYGKARVFGTTLGHHNETMQQTLYLDLVTRGLLWTLDKLDDKHLRKVTVEQDSEAQKQLDPQGKQPTPAKPSQAGPAKTGGKKIKVPNNLALGKPASATATQGGHDPGHAVDGQPGTRWCAANDAAGYSWQVDLEKPETLTGCQIVWEFDGRRYRYKVEGSPDGKQWSMLADATSTEIRDQVQTHKFEATGVRHVRITSTELPPNGWMSFWEFRVHGTELVEAAADAIAAKPALQPASAAGLLSQVKAPDGFRVTMFAAPPDASYPACLAAAPTGEIYVGVDENGSLGKDPQRRQQIVSCRDTDGDGAADKFQVFADKVGSVRGLFYDHGTVWALHPPLLRAFHDDDGDGVADRNETLVEGLGTPELGKRGADHCTNGFRVGIDGWIYIAVGDFGFTKAVGRDGTELQLHGGGIVRVRPDGAELEIYARGLRNIYDVAIDPLMNAFTRDNTNDGGGWDIRVSHIIPTGHYGYPSLFKNFSDEIIQPLGVFGGGSGTGKVFVSEPGLPEGYGHTLYTCDWGRNVVFRHAVTKKGAGFTADQQDFVQIQRPTDMDVDGQGRMYIASWQDGGFSFSRPDVGFVVQLTPEPAEPAHAFPDLPKATDQQLVALLASPSHVCRLHAQLEILRRGPKPTFADGIAKLAASADSQLAVRVAAIFTLKQLLGTGSHDMLLKLTENDQVREFTLRALADRKSQLTDLPLKPFVDALSDADPRVRLQAAVALGRIGQPAAGEALLAATVDIDALVAHAAMNSAIQLQAVDASFRAIDSGSVDIAGGAIRVLQALHQRAVVDGLVVRLQRATSPEMRHLLFRGLCRLYHREADWNGNWWGTRPNTDGPYFNAATWDESEKIREVLKFVLASANGAESKGLLVELNRHKIDLGNAGPQLFALAEKDPALRSTALTLLQQRSAIPAEAMSLVRTAATADESDAVVRSQALALLRRTAERPEDLDFLLDALSSIGDQAGQPEVLLLARDQFIYDPQHAKSIDFFARQLREGSGPRRELACMVLLAASENPRIAASAQAAAASAVEKAWETPQLVETLLRAAGRTYSVRYADRIERHLRSEDPGIREAARFAVDKVKAQAAASGGAAAGTPIAELGIEKALSAVQQLKGDAELGRHLFLRQGCISCHTVSSVEAPMGPMLADIGRRYNRAELAESVLKPSAKIAQGFDTQWFETADGLTIDGFVVRQSGSEIEVRTTEGTSKVIPVAEIAARGKREVSTMPDGLAGNLTPTHVASLLAYLESLKSP